MKAGGFWSGGVTAFFDVRVTHVTSKTNQGKPTAVIFKEQKSEKKQKYQAPLSLFLGPTAGWVKNAKCL